MPFFTGLFWLAPRMKGQIQLSHQTPCIYEWTITTLSIQTRCSYELTNFSIHLPADRHPVFIYVWDKYSFSLIRISYRLTVQQDSVLGLKGTVAWDFLHFFISPGALIQTLKGYCVKSINHQFINRKSLSATYEVIEVKIFGRGFSNFSG
jgi:hypothetical protein